MGVKRRLRRNCSPTSSVAGAVPAAWRALGEAQAHDDLGAIRPDAGQAAHQHGPGVLELLAAVLETGDRARAQQTLGRDDLGRIVGELGPRVTGAARLLHDGEQGLLGGHRLLELVGLDDGGGGAAILVLLAHLGRLGVLGERSPAFLARRIHDEAVEVPGRARHLDRVGQRLDRSGGQGRKGQHAEDERVQSEHGASPRQQFGASYTVRLRTRGSEERRKGRDPDKAG